MSISESSIVGEVTPGKRSNLVTGTVNFYQIPIERLSKANPANVQEIAASQIALLSNYHNEVLDQAKKSFLWALIAAGIGLLFFLSAIGIIIYRQATEIAIVSAIGGALIEFISAINFYLYGKTASQMADFQLRLDKTQRYLLANSMCESLDGKFKHKTRAELILAIAGISYDHDEDNSDVKENDFKNQSVKRSKT